MATTTRTPADRYRARLEQMAGRVRDTAANLEEQVRTPTGGEAGGGIGNVPMHLGDVGTAAFTQELSATLLENEAYIRDEVTAALGRLDAGTFGRCERCGTAVPDERLDALPYTRFCTPCAAETNAGVAVNLNVGRPPARGDEYSRPDGDPETGETPRTGERSDSRDRLFTDLEPAAADAEHTGDVHAAGTAGGGTAVGGLAGTNVADGDPDAAGLEDAMGSGNFDADLDADDPRTDGYGGSAGGAVGGTPAGKRARGGRTHGGTSPRPGASDAQSGRTA